MQQHVDEVERPGLHSEQTANRDEEDVHPGPVETRGQFRAEGRDVGRENGRQVGESVQGLWRTLSTSSQTKPPRREFAYAVNATSTTTARGSRERASLDHPDVFMSRTRYSPSSDGNGPFLRATRAI